MPNKYVVRYRPVAAETPSPMIKPATVIAVPCLKIKLIMLRGVAPSAVRTPISRVRCATPYDRPPKRPIAAISSANAANPSRRSAYRRSLARLCISRASIVAT
jgi:hypothetical protein